MRVFLFYTISLICTQKIAGQNLSIGDSVPNIEFGYTLNYSSNILSLSDFPGKLVILDFWATWCASCIHGFPKLDSLQQKFGDKLQIILVNAKDTRDDSSSVLKFLNKWKNNSGRDFHLVTVFFDTVANKLFEHHLIPHYVWINKERRVIAFSSTDAVNEKNIDAALNGVPLDFTMKRDQDQQRPLFSNESIPVN